MGVLVLKEVFQEFGNPNKAWSTFFVKKKKKKKCFSFVDFKPILLVHAACFYWMALGPC